MCGVCVCFAFLFFFAVAVKVTFTLIVFCFSTAAASAFLFFNSSSLRMRRIQRRIYIWHREIRTPGTTMIDNRKLRNCRSIHHACTTLVLSYSLLHISCAVKIARLAVRRVSVLIFAVTKDVQIPRSHFSPE
uniref:Uncharacterized protein n=1 Tax=Anopheles darlingi TaxID=43151 RepID=A0A2M4DGM2_ANODA